MVQVDSSDASSTSSNTDSHAEHPALCYKSAKSYLRPGTQRPSKSLDNSCESANDLTEQRLRSASTQATYDSSDVSSSPTQISTPNGSLVTFKSSLRRIVSVLNLVQREKTVIEKEDERRLREENMYLTRPAICRLPLKSMTSYCLSLSGCGFLGSYHIGAMNCLLKNGSHIMSRLERAAGASVGSLVASLLILAPDKMEPALNVLYEMADELISLRFGALTPGYCLNERLIKVVDGFLPHDISPAQGRLFISVTWKKERKNQLISQFSSREHLLQCLMASCFIPMYSMGYGSDGPIIDGHVCVDGGYTNNLPDFDDIRTITVSPFSGNAEISPKDEANFFDWKMMVCNQIMNVNLRNIVRGAQALFPPSREILMNYCELGFKDTFRFLAKHDVLQRQEGTAV